MDSMTSQITSITIVYSAVYSGADQRKHQSSAPLAFVLPSKFHAQIASNAEMFPFDDVIMEYKVSMYITPAITLIISFVTK